MKTPLFSIVVPMLALLLGAAAAFLKPMKPVQVGAGNHPNGNYQFMIQQAGLLDNPGVAADPNIHPARKCTYRAAPTGPLTFDLVFLLGKPISWHGSGASPGSPRVHTSFCRNIS